jgi:hypothetical protein
LEIAFCDMPGEWLDDPAKRGEWINLLQVSDIVVNVISAPAMMERGREYNEDINKPSRFNEYLGAAFGGWNPASKSFFLVPVKCEKYMERVSDLVSTVRDVYENQRTLLRAKGQYCHVLPVNTLGSVVFDQFTLNERGDPVDHYRLEDRGSPEWRPRNHEVLMAHILDFYLVCFQQSFPSASERLQPLRRQLADRLVAEQLEGPATPKYPKFEIPPDKGCFGPETEVILSDGRRLPISEVATGMMVLAVDAKGLLVPGVVAKVQRHVNQPMTQLVFQHCALRVTGRHPLRVGGKWLRAQDLRVGDLVDASDGRAQLRAISHDVVLGDAYNLVVRGHGCYFAGGILASSFVTLYALRQWTNRLSQLAPMIRNLEAQNG